MQSLGFKMIDYYIGSEERLPKREGMGINKSYYENGEKILSRRGRDDHPKIESSKKKMIRLIIRRKIKKNIDSRFNF